MGTILNHLQKQEKEKRGLLWKYKKTVKLNEELQASAQESSRPKNRAKKTSGGTATTMRSRCVKSSDDNPTTMTTSQVKATQAS